MMCCTLGQLGTVLLSLFLCEVLEGPVSGKLHPQVFKELTTLSLKICEGFQGVKGP